MATLVSCALEYSAGTNYQAPGFDLSDWTHSGGPGTTFGLNVRGFRSGRADDCVVVDLEQGETEREGKDFSLR